MDQSIVLDDKSFKALSAESRVGIMKSLNERRRTLSELSQKLELGSSTVKEHCDILVGADLIKMVDEGRKWKYYELTQKGKKIMTPSLLDEVKVLIVLCLGAVIFGGFVIFMLSIFTASMGAQSAPMAAKSIAEDSQVLTTIAGTEANSAITPAARDASLANSTLPAEMMAGIIIVLVIIAIIAWAIYRKRMRKNKFSFK